MHGAEDDTVNKEDMANYINSSGFQEQQQHSWGLQQETYQEQQAAAKINMIAETLEPSPLANAMEKLVHSFEALSFSLDKLEEQLQLVLRPLLPTAAPDNPEVLLTGSPHIVEIYSLRNLIEKEVERVNSVVARLDT